MQTATTVTNIRRHLYIYGEIGDIKSYTDLMIEMDTDWNIPVEDITLHINSPGGSVHTLLSLMDRLKGAKSLSAIAEGECASAALFLFLQADLRASSPNSLLMAHNLMMGNSISSIQNIAEHTDKISEMSTRLIDQYISPFINKKERTALDNGKELYFDVAAATKNKMINCKVDDLL